MKALWPGAIEPSSFLSEPGQAWVGLAMPGLARTCMAKPGNARARLGKPMKLDWPNETHKCVAQMNYIHRAHHIRAGCGRGGMFIYDNSKPYPASTGDGPLTGFCVAG